MQIEFMQKFGYLDQTGPQALIAEDALVVALKLTQKFGGLEQTGIFDNNTLKVCKLFNKFLLSIPNSVKLIIYLFKTY